MVAGVPAGALNIVAADGGTGTLAAGYGFRRQMVYRHGLSSLSLAERAQFPEETGKCALTSMRD